MKRTAALASLALAHSMIPGDFDCRDWPSCEKLQRDPAIDAERIAAAQAKRERRAERNRRLTKRTDKS